jgi:hypothetical protein
VNTVVAVLAVLASAVANPQRPVEDERCSRWQGSVSGNDPSVHVTASLCEKDGHITGTLAWKSDKSGTSTRALDGMRSKDAVVLHDTAMSGTPNPGWRFCLIDKYELTGAGSDTLSGTYQSKRCRDVATIELHRVR